MSQIRFCPECGNDISPGDAFCGMCGTPLPAAADAPAGPGSAEQTEGAQEPDSGGSPWMGTIVALVLLFIVAVNLRDWLGWSGEAEPGQPASRTFSEWANQGIARPEVPEKGGFTNVKAQSDADSPESLDELLGEAVLQAAEQFEVQPSGDARPVDIGSAPVASGHGGSPPGMPQAAPMPGSAPPGMPAVVPTTAGARIPYLGPGEQIFISGILQSNCNSGVDNITFELTVDSDGSVNGDLLSDGWFYAPLRGSMTASGELDASGQLLNGGDIRISGSLTYNEFSLFLKGGGPFRLDATGPRGSVRCTDQWLTELL